MRSPVSDASHFGAVKEVAAAIRAHDSNPGTRNHGSAPVVIAPPQVKSPAANQGLAKKAPAAISLRSKKY